MERSGRRLRFYTVGAYGAAEMEGDVFRIAGIGLVGLSAIGVCIYCIFDVIVAEEVLVRNLPRGVWLMIVLFFATVGPSRGSLCDDRCTPAGDGATREGSWAGGGGPREGPGRPRLTPPEQQRRGPPESLGSELVRREEELRRRREDPPRG